MGSKKIVHGRITVGKTRWKKTLELRCLDRSGCQERAAWRSLYRSCARGWRSKAVRWVTCYNRSGHHVSGAEYDSTDITNYEGIRQKCVPTIEKKGARDIIRGCHNRDKGTAENERLRNPKFIFSYPKNERMIFLGGRNAAQEEISTMRVG